MNHQQLEDLRLKCENVLSQFKKKTFPTLHEHLEFF